MSSRTHYTTMHDGTVQQCETELARRACHETPALGEAREHSKVRAGDWGGRKLGRAVNSGNAKSFQRFAGPRQPELELRRLGGMAPNSSAQSRSGASTACRSTPCFPRVRRGRSALKAG